MTPTPTEQEVIDSLPKPPAMGTITTSTLWIVEWLGENDRKTGLELFEWAEKRRPGWARYQSASSSQELVGAIKAAETFARRNQAKPILHIEAHGNDDGLSGGEWFYRMA